MTTATDESIELIDGRIRELRRQREEVEAAQFTERELPRLRALLGKTYAYRNNSYSCPDKPSDYWDVFRKVVRVVTQEAGVWLLFEECSIDRNGKPTLSVEGNWATRADWATGWTPCPAKEYEQQRRRVLSEIDSPDTYVARLGAD